MDDLPGTLHPYPGNNADHRLWLGLHGPERADDAGNRAPLPPSQPRLALHVHNSLYVYVTVIPYNSSDWRLSASQPSEKAVHKQVPLSNISHLMLRVRRFCFDFPQILSWFADVPRLLCPFSLHAMMKQAQARGHSPGDWFGPSQVAMLLR